ncbi:endonuclease III [Lachnospiraceae bacterium 62-35]
MEKKRGVEGKDTGTEKPVNKKVRENLPYILNKLDELYGVTKDGFYHHEPWQLLLAIMLSAQSTDKQVDEAIPALFDHYRTVEAVAEAPVEEIEGYIRSVGLYKNKARNMKECCRQLVKDYKGRVPDQMEELLKLAGVGRKTANLFLSDAYGIPGVTVDTHVFRISRRLGWSSGKNPLETEKELCRLLPKEHWIRINFQLIYHGRAICTARKSNCSICPMEEWCMKQL